jgi:hypothetical protein
MMSSRGHRRLGGECGGCVATVFQADVSHCLAAETVSHAIGIPLCLPTRPTFPVAGCLMHHFTDRLNHSHPRCLTLLNTLRFLSCRLACCPTNEDLSEDVIHPPTPPTQRATRLQKTDGILDKRHRADQFLRWAMNRMVVRGTRLGMSTRSNRSSRVLGIRIPHRRRRCMLRPRCHQQLELLRDGILNRWTIQVSWGFVALLTFTGRVTHAN